MIDSQLLYKQFLGLTYTLYSTFSFLQQEAKGGMGMWFHESVKGLMELLMDMMQKS